MKRALSRGPADPSLSTWKGRFLGRPASSSVSLGGVAALVAVMAQAGPASAQVVGDLRIRMPNVFMVIDNSAAMLRAKDGSAAYDCSAGEKSRWVTLVEVLTGTVNDLECDTSSSTMRIRSDDCYPVHNCHSQITDAVTGLRGDLYSFPYRQGNPKNLYPIKFQDGSESCSSSSNSCRYNQGGNEWNQANDGLLDTYGDRIRFGLSTFDGLANVADIPWPIAISAQASGAGVTWSSSSVFSYRNASYWWDAGAATTWLTGTPAFGGDILMYTPNFVVAVPDCPYSTPAGTTGLYRCVQNKFDVGIQNPRALPWAGRMVGFGDPDATTADTIAHNEMAQLVVIGATRRVGYNSSAQYNAQYAPLAASMRDVYQLIRNDFGAGATEAVTKPHLYSTPATKVPIGPRNDPYYLSGGGGCRDQHVIVFTQGEAAGDIEETMGSWAKQLLVDEGVTTLVVGVGLDTANWINPGTLLVEPIDCKTDLTDADLLPNTNVVCERHPVNPLAWRFADHQATDVGDPTGLGLDLLPGTPDDVLSNADRAGIRACCNLLETAVMGSPTPATARPYFAQNQAQLKNDLAGVLQAIAGGTLSRTLPVFANATPTKNVGSAAADGYELRSSLDVPPTLSVPALPQKESLWEGHLERIRTTCVAGVATPQAMDPLRGDDFEKNLVDGGTRYFVSVNIEDKERNSFGSVRSRSGIYGDPNSWDYLFESGTNDVGDFNRLTTGGAGVSSGGVADDALIPRASFAAQLDAAESGPVGASDHYELLELKGSDKNGCDSATNSGSGGSWEDRCTDRILNWYLGGKTQLGTEPLRASQIGAIYKSNPVVIGPPLPAQGDELYDSDRLSGAVSFTDAHKLRPTMLYAQSVDGQLHAFVMSKNAPDGPTGYNAVPKPDANTVNNELWTLVPPAVFPQLWPNFDQHARLVDGPIAWADVALKKDVSGRFYPYRTATDVANGVGEYRTILVVSGGPSTAGGWYYAVDVTDPTKPRFLWQLSTAGEKKDERKPLFGDFTPAAAITTLRLNEGAGFREIPVAILSGGGYLATPNGYRTTRRSATPWGGIDHQPRTHIRDWGDNRAGRSVTVVELYSGRIIMRMGGDHCPGCGTPYSDHPLDDSDNPILHDQVTLPDDGDPGIFDSPITSAPVPYPAGVGKISSRIYVGDADGTMWRINVSDPDPELWTAEIAFDGYNRGGGGKKTLEDAWIEVGPGSPGTVSTALGGVPDDIAAATMGQPVISTPLLSTDSREAVTVTFATGDQEGFQLSSAGMVNLLITFVDYINPATGQFQPYTNYRLFASDPALQGVEMAFMDGTRVTGPLNMFDGTILFGYFEPGAPGAACTFGQGGWCGIHYLDHDGANPGEPRATMDLDGGGGIERCTPFAADEVVFGISLRERPSCQTGTSTPAADTWLSGSYGTQSTQVSGGFEVVMHTGQGGSVEAGGGQTKSMRKGIDPPRARSYVRSWASAIE